MSTGTQPGLIPSMRLGLEPGRVQWVVRHRHSRVTLRPCITIPQDRSIRESSPDIGYHYVSPRLKINGDDQTTKAVESGWIGPALRDLKAHFVAGACSSFARRASDSHSGPTGATASLGFVGQSTPTYFDKLGGFEIAPAFS